MLIALNMHMQVQAAAHACAGDAALQHTDEPARLWLPAPAALTQHHCQPPPVLHSNGSERPASATAANEQGFQTLASCDGPGGAASCAHDQLEQEVQPPATALSDIHVLGLGGPASEANWEDPFAPPASEDGLMPQLQPGRMWQGQLSSPRPPGTAAGLMHEPSAPRTGQLPDMSGNQMTPAGRALVHQPSLAAWVLPGRLEGAQLQPLHLPCSGDLDPFRFFGPQPTGLHQAALSPSAWQTGELNRKDSEHDLRALLPAADHSVPTEMAAQQTGVQPPPDNGQVLHTAHQGRAGGPSIFGSMGPSLLGNEDSLCAFLGGCQRFGAAPQPRSALAITRSACDPPMPPGECGTSAAQHSAQPDTAAPIHPQQTGIVPASHRLAGGCFRLDSHPLVAAAARAAESGSPAGNADGSAEKKGACSGAAAEDLLHAEGEDFWRCLIGVVNSYQGVVAGAG